MTHNQETRTYMVMGQNDAVTPVGGTDRLAAEALACADSVAAWDTVAVYATDQIQVVREEDGQMICSGIRGNPVTVYLRGTAYRPLVPIVPQSPIATDLVHMQARVVAFAGQLQAWGLDEAARQILREILDGPVDAPDYYALQEQVATLKETLVAVRLPDDAS